MTGRIAGMGLVAALAACGVPGQTGGPMREAVAAEVTACRYITDITMTPGVYGPVLTERALTLPARADRADPVGSRRAARLISAPNQAASKATVRRSPAGKRVVAW